MSIEFTRAALITTALILASTTLQAQTLLPPPNIILPNYDRTLVGKVPSLEAGAYGARVDDASSNWYNPAGLIGAKKSAINASSSAYRWTGVSVEAGGSTTGSQTGAQPPSFLGVVIGSPPLGTDRVRIGLSVTNEVYWAPILQSQIIRTTQAGENQRLLYSARDNFTETIPAIAIAYAASDSLRLGFSIAGDIVSFQANDAISNQLVDASSQTVFSRNSQINASALNLLASIGIQYDASDHWKLSMVLKSPSIPLMGNSKITLVNVLSSGGTTSNTAFYEPDGEFNYSRPMQASFGIAYVSRPFEIEAEIKYHAALGTYTVLASSQSVVETSSSGGAPTTTSRPAEDVTNQLKSVTNIGIGSKLALSDSFGLHAGFFSSKSPIADGNSTIFRKVDLYGITFGAAFRIDQFSASLGAAYEFGKSDPYQVPTSEIGEFVDTTVSVTSISLLYAVSFSF